MDEDQLRIINSFLLHSFKVVAGSKISKGRESYINTTRGGVLEVTCNLYTCDIYI